MQIEDCPLAIELSTEQTRSPPPMLPNATLRADVKTYSIDASVARTLADLACTTIDFVLFVILARLC